MSKLIVLITPRIDAAHQIGECWQAASASGVTFIESHGLFRLQEKSKTMRVLPGMMSMMEILRQNEEHNVCMFSVVDASLVPELMNKTEAIIGDISLPDNGIIFVLDVEQTFGLRG